MTSDTRPPLTGLELSDAEFAAVARIAATHAGLSLSPAKRIMISSRLAKRLRARRIESFGEYLALLDADSEDDERKALISALTTNVSHFFREEHHFELLRSDILPDLIARAAAGERIRLWSAGCSTGQEPYSMAMTLLEAGADPDRHDIRILATDIDEAVLAAARTGVYDPVQTKDLDAARRARFFTPHEGGLKIRAEPAAFIRFRQLNLVGPWPVRGPFDIVFCRNVVIYFAADTQAALWPRFEAVLSPGGWLFLGHSERVAPGSAPGLVTSGVTAYRKGAPETVRSAARGGL